MAGTQDTPAGPPALELRLLGEFAARDGAGNPINVKAKKNRALMGAVALAPSGTMLRENLASLLWSDRGQEQARSSLRQALASLRQDFASIDPPVLAISDVRVGLDRDRIEIDACSFQRLAASDEAAQLRRAVMLYRGELLADVDSRDPALQQWLASERRRLHDLAVDVLTRLCAVETDTARIETATRLVALDPLREASHRVLMQAYVEAGECALALRQYEICRDAVRAQLGVDPGEEIEALRCDLLRPIAPADGERPKEGLPGPPVSRVGAAMPAVPDASGHADIAVTAHPPSGADLRTASRSRSIVLTVAGVGVAVSALLALLIARFGTEEPARTSVKITGQQFDPSVVPLISDAARRSLATYRERPDAKALAIARGHMVVVDGASDVDQARAEALRRCAAGARPASVCRIYTVGTEVVWSRESLPLPPPSELRAEPIDVPLVVADIPTIPARTRNRVAERYVGGPAPKALALTTGGIWYVRERSSRAEAARLAVEECTDYWQRPCILLSVDGLLTIQIPKSRAVTRIFLPSTEDGISSRDRQRVSEVYQGNEWRALARGKSGGWYPVAAAPSEAAAIDAALSQCAKSDTECRLHAIGNFHVSEESR